MKKTEKLIDAMAEVDEDLLSAHVQVKKPTKTQKIRKYAGAAAIYVAACLVVALLLPFIIGNEENPESQPGEKPIVTETHSPVTDDPEAKKINVADIYKTYCDVTAEMMEQSVTIDEVNNIITAVEKAYAEYDFIIMRNESIMETTPKKSDVKFSDLKETGEDDSMIEQYHKYHANVLEIIWDALEARLPEGEGDYYNDFMDDAESDDLVRFDITDDIAEGGKASIAIDYPQGLRALVYHPYDKDGKIQDSDNMTVLYPDGKAQDILITKLRSPVPMNTAEFDGFELTILLEKDCYFINENITATVVLENVGDGDITLYQGYLGGFLDEVQFLENGEYKPYYKEQRAFDEAIQTTVLKPGKYIIHKETFSPFKPYYNPDETASMDSLWEIEASVMYYPVGYTGDGNIPWDEMKTGTVRINVPHDTDVDAVPDPDSVVVGYDGKNGTFIREDSYYPCELLYRRVNNAFEENGNIMHMRVWHAVRIDEIREKYPYAEFVYDTPKTVCMRDYVTDNMINTEPLKRICFTRSGDDYMMILSKDEAYTDIYGTYVCDGFKNVIDAIGNIAEDFAERMTEATELPPETTTITAPPPETTTITAPPPETTTTTQPPETEPPIVIPELKEGQRIDGDFVVCAPNWTVEYFGNGGDVFVPDGVTLIESGTFTNNGHKITSLRIPASFNAAIVGNVFGGLTSLQYYSVDENCYLLEVVNGVLYNKRVGINANVKRTLISVPGSYSEFTVPADVEIINGLAVYNCRNMKYINVDSGNNTFISLNGVVVTRDTKTIVLVPPGIEELYVPAETEGGFLGFARDEPLGACTMLKTYNVDSANPLFSSPGGLLCSKEGSVLYSVPGGITDCVIPDGVTKIDWGAFRHTGNIVNVTIPDSVTEISPETFWYTSNLTIHCSAGSYAAQYAAENGIAWTAN